MKQLIINEQNPNGMVVEIEELGAPASKDAIRSFFEGLASGDTNSIAKIRALAKEFLESGCN